MFQAIVGYTHPSRNSADVLTDVLCGLREFGLVRSVRESVTAPIPITN